MSLLILILILIAAYAALELVRAYKGLAEEVRELRRRCNIEPQEGPPRSSSAQM